MKQIITFLIILFMSCSVVACGEDSTFPGAENNESVVTDYGKILIVYFSRTGYNYPNQWLEIGHTARVAEFIKELTGADSFEIVPVVPYPDDYEETKTISTYERDNDLRPEFKGEVENIDDYDLVFIGGPVWYGGMPMIIHTFYEMYKGNLNGKTIVPFSTHAGSGLADAERLAKAYCPDSKVLPGLAVQGTNSMNSWEDVKDWLIRIGVLDNSSEPDGMNTVNSFLEISERYFALNGMPVKSPDRGLYIKVRNGKVQKVKL